MGFLNSGSIQSRTSRTGRGYTATYAGRALFSGAPAAGAKQGEERTGGVHRHGGSEAGAGTCQVRTPPPIHKHTCTCRRPSHYFDVNEHQNGVWRVLGASPLPLQELVD